MEPERQSPLLHLALLPVVFRVKERGTTESRRPDTKTPVVPSIWIIITDVKTPVWVYMPQTPELELQSLYTTLFQSLLPQSHAMERERRPLLLHPRYVPVAL